MGDDIWGDLSESFGLAATPVALLEMLREFEGYSYRLGRHVEVSVEENDVMVWANEVRNRLDPWTGRPQREVKRLVAARFALTKSEQGIQVRAKCPSPTICGAFFESLVDEMKQRFAGDDAFVRPEETRAEMLLELLLEGTKNALRATNHEVEESQEANGPEVTGQLTELGIATPPPEPMESEREADTPQGKVYFPERPSTQAVWRKRNELMLKLDAMFLDGYSKGKYATPTPTMRHYVAFPAQHDGSGKTLSERTVRRILIARREGKLPA